MDPNIYAKARHPEKEDHTLKGSSRARLVTIVKKIRGFFRRAIVTIRCRMRENPTREDVTMAKKTLDVLEHVLEYRRSGDGYDD